ncbi:restriction endonuclease subunit S [Enorma phocaeensis]|uniref:restriction endonuclease subunit S n=1 Tax=Enorma phocaeensis TaxID=1871019 RepID=UPI000C8300A1|nr:restriction endonuclease subunit S [Enorma phocaeensis]
MSERKKLWSGDVPETWKVAPLKHCIAFRSDSLSEGTNPDYWFRYVDIGSVTASSGITGYAEMAFRDAPSRARKRVRRGDTIVSTVRTYLKAIARIEDDEDVIVSTGFAVLDPCEFDSLYLTFLMSSDLVCEEIKRRSWGIAYPAISETSMSSIVVPIPPLLEQQLIAGYLRRACTKLDSACSVLERQLQTLDDYRKSLIQEAVTKGLNPNAEMKSSGIDIVGAIPAHWSTSKLRHVCTRIFDGPFGSNLTGDDYSDEGVRVVRLENLKYLEFDDSKQSFVSEDKYRSISAHTVYPDDLILATFVEDDISVCKLPEYIGYAVNKSDCVGLRLKGAVSQDYLHYYLSSNSVWQFLCSQLHGATRGRVNTTQIKQIPVVLPPFNEQAAIVEHLNSRMVTIDRLIIGKRKQLETLRAQRQSLIYEYVTGKRRVV